MPTWNEAAFTQRFSKKTMRTQDLASAKQLADLDMKSVDANADGEISKDELPALFHQISDGESRFETTREQRKILGLFGPGVQTPTHAGRKLAALERIVANPENPQRGLQGHDPFHQELRMPKGPYAGEKLDTDTARSAQRLSPAEVKFYAEKAGIDPEDIAIGFANLRQKFPKANGEADHTFSVALVPKDAVADVALLKETFPAPVPAAHTLLRFSLKPGQEAYVIPQAHGDTRPIERQQNLALSIEAIGPKGWSYDLVSGVRDHFATSYNMETVESRFRHAESYDPPHPIEQLPLKLTDAEKQRLLVESVDTATRNGMSRMYNTLSLNCTNELFGVLDRGIGNKVPPHVHLARAMTSETLPVIAGRYLSLRGILDENRTLPTLRDEMTTLSAANNYGGRTTWKF